MKKSITGIESIRIRNKVIRNEIINCCDISEDIYNNILFERGIEWILKNMPKGDKVLSIVSSSSFFWNWFKNQWFNRENDFLAEYVLYVLRAEQRDKQFMYYNWLKLHSIDRITVFPSGPEWDIVLKLIFKTHE